jgi:hypothetical protein
MNHLHVLCDHTNMISKQWGNSLRDPHCYHLQIKIDWNNNDFIIPTYHLNILKKIKKEILWKGRAYLVEMLNQRHSQGPHNTKVFLEGIWVLSLIANVDTIGLENWWNCENDNNYKIVLFCIRLCHPIVG